MEAGYLGDCFGRPSPESFLWLADDAEPNAGMWATAEESTDDIIGLYHRVWSHSDATVAELELDALGQVPWWPPERREVTLHQILVHVLAETHRHSGHADIVREQIDGTVGLRPDNDNLPSVEAAGWQGYRNQLERVAREVGGAPEG